MLCFLAELLAHLHVCMHSSPLKTEYLLPTTKSSEIFRKIRISGADERVHRFGLIPFKRSVNHKLSITKNLSFFLDCACLLLNLLFYFV